MSALYRPDWVADYFDELGVVEWERMVKDPFAEVRHHVHVHYLQQFVVPGAHVLEIGAGAGRYTQVLAEMGCTITVADISPGQLELNRRFAQELDFVDAVAAWHQVDVCDLNIFQPAQFEALVAYGGPLSYVFEGREQALTECMRVTKVNGPLLFGVMSLWGSAHAAMQQVLEIAPENNHQIVRTGDMTAQTLPGARHFCHMFRAAELRAFLDRAGLKLLAMSASNVLSTNMGAQLHDIRQDEVKWAELLRMELEAGAEPGCLDMGTHLIAVVERTTAGAV